MWKQSDKNEEMRRFFSLGDLFQPVGFGRHREKLLADVIISSPDYIAWACGTGAVTFSKCLWEVYETVSAYEKASARLALFVSDPEWLAYYAVLEESQTQTDAAEFAEQYDEYIGYKTQNAKILELSREARLSLKSIKESLIWRIHNGGEAPTATIKEAETKESQLIMSDTIGVVEFISSGQMVGEMEKGMIVWEQVFSRKTSSSINALYRTRIGENELELRNNNGFFSWTLNRKNVIKIDNIVSRMIYKAISNHVDETKTLQTPVMIQKRTDTVTTGTERRITPVDVIVRTNTFFCNKNHTLEDVTAVVMILDKSGNQIEARFPVSYCKACNIYFLLETVFTKIKRKGTVLAQIITQEEYTRRSSGTERDIRLQAESVLHRYGYNVSKTEGLSTEQRRGILCYVIDEKILTKGAVISYLDWFMSMQGRKNTNMKEAVSKWKADRDFIIGYSLNKGRQVLVDSITIS